MRHSGVLTMARMAGEFGHFGVTEFGFDGDGGEEVRTQAGLSVDRAL